MTSSISTPTRRCRAWAVAVAMTVSVVATCGVMTAGAVPAGAAVGPSVPGVCTSVGLADGAPRVALVIDYGDVAGSPGRVDTYCVGIEGRVNGFDLLAAAGLRFRTNASGLVCGIGGFPGAPECGDTTDGGYRYWAYFRGGDAWAYRSVGPGSSYPSDGMVEGWRFVQGKGNPTDPPPRHAPGFTSVCAPAPPTTAPPTTATPTTTPVPTTPAGPAPGAPGAPTTTAPAQVSTSTATGAGAATDAATATDGTAGPDGAAEDATGTTAGTADGRVVGRGADDGAMALAASTITDVDGGGGSTGPIAAGVGGLAVLGLGALAVLRFRRPDEVDLP